MQLNWGTCAWVLFTHLMDGCARTLRLKLLPACACSRKDVITELLGVSHIPDDSGLGVWLCAHSACGPFLPAHAAQFQSLLSCGGVVRCFEESNHGQLWAQLCSNREKLV